MRRVLGSGTEKALHHRVLPALCLPARPGRSGRGQGARSGRSLRSRHSAGACKCASVQEQSRNTRPREPGLGLETPGQGSAAAHRPCLRARGVCACVRVCVVCAHACTCVHMQVCDVYSRLCAVSLCPGVYVWSGLCVSVCMCVSVSVYAWSLCVCLCVSPPSPAREDPVPSSFLCDAPGGSLTLEPFSPAAVRVTC